MTIVNKWAWADLNHQPRPYQECGLRNMFAASKPKPWPGELSVLQTEVYEVAPLNQALQYKEWSFLEP